MASEEELHDKSSLLFTPLRDYLIRNNGDQVKNVFLNEKVVGLYFSASWCGPCRRFTPVLTEAYNELSQNGNFEVVIITADEDIESFNSYFSKMPWLAIPFSDSEVRDQLNELFSVDGIPHLVILNEMGKVVTDNGVGIIQEYGHFGFPFSEEKIKELKEKEEEAKKNQSLRTLLTSGTRDFVIASDGRRVPILELEGKTVGIYFALDAHKSSCGFTKKLVQVYEDLKAKGADFEIVMVPLDEAEESFQQLFSRIPWLSLPFKDKLTSKLIRYFELCTLPTLTIIAPDGKTLNPNVAEVVDDHGALAFPFTPGKFVELEEIQKAKEASQTFESLLVHGDKDFVIGKNESKISVSSLTGKNVLLYFSASWCPPCRAFRPKLIEAYHKIKAKENEFEVIFISSDRDQKSFDENYAAMPWLALPFGDERKASLSCIFKVQGIPMLVAIGPTGKTVSKDARNHVSVHGADAYPFTDERLKEIEAEQEEIRKSWPEKLTHNLHENHELVLTPRKMYICDFCNKPGNDWSFHCKECDFDLHPKCALKDEKEEDGEPKHEWVCEGDTCRKA